MRAQILLAALAGLALAGCSSGSPEDNPEGDQNASVGVRDFNYNPSTVNIRPGSTVEWTNTGAVGHTVTADDGSFDSGTIDPGRPYSREFADEGTFTYSCKLHPTMEGTITVKA